MKHILALFILLATLAHGQKLANADGSNVSDFANEWRSAIGAATTAQGALAATAIQPSDIASGTITPKTGDLDFNNLGGAPTNAQVNTAISTDVTETRNTLVAPKIGMSAVPSAGQFMAEDVQTNPQGRGIYLGDSICYAPDKQFRALMGSGGFVNRTDSVALGATLAGGAAAVVSPGLSPNSTYAKSFAGTYTTLSTGTVTFHEPGSATSGILGSRIIVWYWSETGGGTFNVAYDTNGSGSYTTLTSSNSTIATNGTVTGATGVVDAAEGGAGGALRYVTFTLTNPVFARVRVTGATGSAKIIAGGNIEVPNGGTRLPGFVGIDCSVGGSDPTQWDDMPDAAITTLVQYWNPDFIYVRGYETLSNWSTEFAALIAKFRAAKPGLQVIIAGMHVTGDNNTNILDSTDKWQQQWCDANSGVFIPIRNRMGDIAWSIENNLCSGTIYTVGSTSSNGDDTLDRVYASSKTFTAATSDICTAASHGFASGDQVTVFSNTTIPAGLTNDAAYYVHYLSSSTFKLCTTYADSIAGTNFVDIQDIGSGTHTIGLIIPSLTSPSTSNRKWIKFDSLTGGSNLKTGKAYRILAGYGTSSITLCETDGSTPVDFGSDITAATFRYVDTTHMTETGSAFVRNLVIESMQQLTLSRQLLNGQPAINSGWQRNTVLPSRLQPYASDRTWHFAGASNKKREIAIGRLDGSSTSTGSYTTLALGANSLDHGYIAGTNGGGLCWTQNPSGLGIIGFNTNNTTNFTNSRFTATVGGRNDLLEVTGVGVATWIPLAASSPSGIAANFPTQVWRHGATTIGGGGANSGKGTEYASMSKDQGLVFYEAGQSVTIKNASNGLAGTVVLSSGVGTITSNAIDANTVIPTPSLKTSSGTPSTKITVSVTSGSATVTGEATDNSTYNWVGFKIN